MDISVWGPSPAAETGRALSGRDAEQVKSGSHRDHPPPEDFLSPWQVASHIQGTDIDQQKNPHEQLHSAELHLSKDKTRPFIPTFPPAFCKEKGAQNKAASTKGGSKRPREVSTGEWGSLMSFTMEQGHKDTHSCTHAGRGESVPDERPVSLREKRALQERTGLGYSSTYCTNPGHIQKYRQ